MHGSSHVIILSFVIEGLFWRFRKNIIINATFFSFVISDTANRLDQTEEELGAMKNRQETLTSHVDTMDRKLVSVEKEQYNLSSHVDTMDRELTSVKTGHETLSSNMDTMDKKLTSVRTEQADLFNKMDRDLTVMRGQLSDGGNMQTTDKGMTKS